MTRPTETWIKSRQEWLNTTKSRLTFVAYTMDVGAIIAYMSDERGRRWNVVFETPRHGRSQLNIKIKLDEGSEGTTPVLAGSIEAAHIVAQLRHAKVNEKIMKENTGESLAKMVENQNRNGAPEKQGDRGADDSNQAKTAEMNKPSK